MPSIDALIQALQQYEDTLVFISHDVHRQHCPSHRRGTPHAVCGRIRLLP
jgi:hypothetical protein